jgi:hypothetical protein
VSHGNLSQEPAIDSPRGPVDPSDRQRPLSIPQYCSQSRAQSKDCINYRRKGSLASQPPLPWVRPLQLKTLSDRKWFTEWERYVLPGENCRCILRFSTADVRNIKPFSQIDSDGLPLHPVYRATVSGKFPLNSSGHYILWSEYMSSKFSSLSF